jgi:hypothetical protein
MARYACSDHVVCLYHVGRMSGSLWAARYVNHTKFHTTRVRGGSAARWAAPQNSPDAQRVWGFTLSSAGKPSARAVSLGIGPLPEAHRSGTSRALVERSAAFSGHDGLDHAILQCSYLLCPAELPNSSGHGCALNTAWWWHCQHDTNSDRAPFWRMLPSAPVRPATGATACGHPLRRWSTTARALCSFAS